MLHAVMRTMMTSRVFAQLHAVMRATVPGGTSLEASRRWRHLSRSDAAPERTSVIVILRACARSLLALYDVILLAHFGAQVSTAPRTPPRRVSRLPLPEALKTYFVSPQLMLDVGDAHAGFSFRRRTPFVGPRPLAGSGAIPAFSSHSLFLTIIIVQARWWLPLCFAVAILPISRPHEPRRSTRGELIYPTCSTPWLMRPRAGEAAERLITDRAATLKARARGAAFDAHAGRGIAIH